MAAGQQTQVDVIYSSIEMIGLRLLTNFCLQMEDDTRLIHVVASWHTSCLGQKC